MIGDLVETRDVRRPGTNRGVTLIEMLVVIAVTMLLIAVVVPAVQSARETARRVKCGNNLHQIGLALNTYESTFGVYPPMRLAGESRNLPGTVFTNCYSVLSRMLPQCEEIAAYNAINFGFPPDFAAGLGANETIMRTSIGMFVCPSDSGHASSEFGCVNYRFSIGPSTMLRDPRATAPGSKPDLSSGSFVSGDALRPAEFKDGLSTTVACSERLQGGSSGHRVKTGGDYKLGNTGYMSADADAAVAYCLSIGKRPAIGYESRGGESWLLSGLHFTNYNHCATPNTAASDCSFVQWTGTIHDRVMIDGVMSASSYHSGGVNVLFMGGEVRRIGDSVNVATWRALATKSRGEIVPSY